MFDPFHGLVCIYKVLIKASLLVRAALGKLLVSEKDMSDG